MPIFTLRFPECDSCLNRLYSSSLCRGCRRACNYEGENETEEPDGIPEELFIEQEDN